MGAFNLTGDDLKAYDHALDIDPWAILVTHTADMMAARITDEGLAGMAKRTAGASR